MKTAAYISLKPAVAHRSGRAVHRSLQLVQEARERIHDGDTVSADGHLLEAQETLQSTRQTLRAEGIGDLDGAPDLLHLSLASLSGPTETEREFLAVLDAARGLAYDVDAERGHVLSDGTPCNLADTLDDVYHRLRMRIEGPQGRD